MNTQPIIQKTDVVCDLQEKIKAMYIDLVQRISTTSCSEFEELARRIHVAEIKLRSMENGGR